MASIRCGFCHDFVPSGHAELPSATKLDPQTIKINLSDLQNTCIYCSLLRRIALHFAPQLPDFDEKRSSVWLYIGDAVPASVEIHGIAAKDISMTTFVRVHMYLQSECLLHLPHNRLEYVILLDH